MFDCCAKYSSMHRYNGAGDLDMIVAGQAPRRHPKIDGEHQTEHDQNRIRNLSHLSDSRAQHAVLLIKRARFAESENNRDVSPTSMIGVANLAQPVRIFLICYLCLLPDRRGWKTRDSLRVLRTFSRCVSRYFGEFSDHHFESFGRPSGRMGFACGFDALCQHPDFKRYGLDQSNEATRRTSA